MVSVLLGVWCREWRWCVLLLVCPTPACAAYAIYSQCILLSTASCHALFSAWCVVCAGECVSVLLCVVGYPSMTLPHSWWWVGPLWMVGWHGEVGWHWWMKGGYCSVDLPVCVLVSPCLVSASPCRSLVVLLNGGGGMCCGVPVFGLGLASCVVMLPLCVALPFAVFAVTALLV